MENVEKKIAKDLLSIEAIFLKPDEPFTWASGIKSPIYCDNRLTLTAPIVRNDVEENLANLIQENYAGAEACAYDIPIDIYNKNFDMFLKGNIGKNGENGIIEQIQNSQKSIYIIKNKNQTLNWQTPTAVIDYIRDNLKEGEKIINFVAYYKE